MKRGFTLVALFAVLALLTTVPVAGQDPQLGPLVQFGDPNLTPPSPLDGPVLPPVNPAIFSSYWWIDPDTDALVELTNNTEVERNLSLHLVEGRDTTRVEKLRLEPRSTVRLSLKSLLGDEEATISRWGSAVLRGETNGVTGWIVSEDTRRSLTVESLFQRPDQAASSVVGQWWLPTDDTHAFFIVQNISIHAQDVRVNLYLDGSRIPGELLTLPAQSTVRLDLEDLAGGLAPSVGAVEIQVESGEPSLFGRTVLMAEQMGFSLSTVMERPRLDLGTELHTPPGPSGVLGARWGFPEGADFTNYMVVSNLSEQPVEITTTMFFTSESLGSWEDPPSTTVLEPLETRLFGGDPSPSGGRFLSARLRHSGQPGDVIAVGIAVDQTMSYSFHCPFLDRELVGSHKMAVTFDLTEDRTTLLLVKNTSDEPLPFRYVLQYQRDGKPQLFTAPDAELGPQELRAINLKDLQGQPGGIPADVTFGSAIVSADRQALIAADPTIDPMRHSVKLCEEYCYDSYYMEGLPSCESLITAGMGFGIITIHGPIEASLINNVPRSNGTFDCKFKTCGTGPCRGGSTFWWRSRPFCPPGIVGQGVSQKFWILRLCSLWDIENLSFRPCI